MNDERRCDRCGYTLVDAILHGDHYLCGGEAPWQADLKAKGEVFETAHAEAVRIAEGCPGCEVEK